MSAKKICVDRKLQRAFDSDNQNQKDLINSLDYDSLAKIFMLLPIPERITMEEVCSKWKEACQLAWYDIRKYKCKSTIGRSYDNCLLTHSYLKKVLLRCGIYLKELSLTRVLDVSIMPVVARNCKNLTRLECEFSEESIKRHHKHFVKAFTQLDKLKFFKIHIKNNDSDGTTNLTEIIDSLPEEINEIHLFPMIEDCKKYFSFTLKKFKNLQKLSLRGFYGDNVIQEIAKKKTLVYLDIQVFEVHRILYLFNRLVNLEHMQISANKYGIPTFSGTELNTIPSTYYHSKHLANLNRVKIPSQKCVYFRSFTLSHPLIIALSKNCKKLKRLEIAHGTIEESTELRLSSASVLDGLSKLRYLEHLNLSFIANLQDSTILAIANNCKKLKFLNIKNCRNITATALMALTSLENLQELNVNSINITDKVIVKLKGLNRLDCVGYMKLTETGIVQFLNNNPDLEFLDITSIYYMNIIDTANKATKNRTNGIILKINTERWQLIKDSKSKVTSRWVVFTSKRA